MKTIEEYSKALEVLNRYGVYHKTATYDPEFDCFDTQYIPIDCKEEKIILKQALDTLEQHKRYIENEPYTLEELHEKMNTPVFCKNIGEWIIINSLILNHRDLKTYVHGIDYDGIEYESSYKDDCFYPREVTE